MKICIPKFIEIINKPLDGFEMLHNLIPEHFQVEVKPSITPLCVSSKMTVVLDIKHQIYFLCRPYFRRGTVSMLLIADSEEKIHLFFEQQSS